MGGEALHSADAAADSAEGEVSRVSLALRGERLGESKQLVLLDPPLAFSNNDSLAFSKSPSLPFSKNRRRDGEATFKTGDRPTSSASEHWLPTETRQDEGGPRQAELSNRTSVGDMLPSGVPSSRHIELNRFR